MLLIVHSSGRSMAENSASRWAWPMNWFSTMRRKSQQLSRDTSRLDCHKSIVVSRSSFIAGALRRSMLPLKWIR